MAESPKILSVFSVRNYLQQSLKLETEPARWGQIVLCGLATSIPLFIGLYQGHPTSGIYGALVGYFLTLNDHFGAIKHRLIVITLTFLMLIAGVVLGLAVEGRPELYLAVAAVLVYWIGLMGGEGAELERAILFATIEFIVTVHSPSFSLERAPYILFYSLLGYGVVVIAAIVHSTLSKRPPNSFARLSSSLKGPLASKRERHVHAVSYMLIAILSILLVRYFEMERGYWVVMTALLVMKPDRRLSMHRSFQRFFGTGLGVFVSEAIIFSFHSPFPLMILIGVGSALVPWASKRNYWLMSMITTVVVILLMDLAVVERGDYHIALLRLEATIIGCLLGGAGVLISKIFSMIIKSNIHAKEQREIPARGCITGENLRQE